jgi:hypothetical protein
LGREWDGIGTGSEKIAASMSEGKKKSTLCRVDFFCAAIKQLIPIKCIKSGRCHIFASSDIGLIGTFQVQPTAT